MDFMELLSGPKQSTASKGKDDTVTAQVSEGEYVLPAWFVAHLGDGNSEAGFEVLDKALGAAKKEIESGKNIKDPRS
jgi:hypothetical protein